jgi:ABC-type glycerol-3-phosphate transport system permease component
MTKRLLLILLYIVLTLFAIVTLTPLIWLVAATLKGNEIFTPLFFPPLNKLTLSSFYNLFSEINFLRYLMNSFFVSGVIVMLQLFFSSLGGFALAKYEFKGKSVVMLIMLTTMMLPYQVLLAPLYELIYKMGLMDSYIGLIAPGIVSVFGMFLFRQAMLNIPDDLLQAGRIDGCSEFGIYWRIVLPVSRPMIGAFCLIAFMGAWNNFLWPQIILQTMDKFTLPIALNQMVGLYSHDYGSLMAGTFLSILPVIILFFLLQKEFISGLTAGAVKG